MWWSSQEKKQEEEEEEEVELTEMPHLILCATINTFQVYTTLSYITLELVERSVQQLKQTNKQQQYSESQTCMYILYMKPINYSINMCTLSWLQITHLVQVHTIR